MPRVFIFLLFAELINYGALGQTCCSGGVPVSNSMGIVNSKIEGLVLNLSFDHHLLNGLYNNNEKVDDNNRKRVTNTTLIQIGGNIKGFTLEGLIPFISQTRLISGNFGKDKTQSFGIGDAAFLIGKDFGNNISGNISIGSKLPTGKINSLNEDEIKLNPDMQSGTGSYDALILLRLFKSIRNNTFYFNGFHTERGTKKDYDPGLDYKFGNESQMTLGWLTQTTIAKNLFDFGLASRLRVVGVNKANQQIIPATGGNWILGNLYSKIYLGEGENSFALNFDLPLWLSVKGFQNVPTYRMNVGFLHILNFKKK